jgi:Cd2+/Zn2+-exporting ATPase
LVISVPAATLSALAFAARRGILVRGGEFIERAGTIDTVALDKTGTLTKGRPVLVEICVCSPVPAGRNCDESDECWNGVGTLSGPAMEILSYAAAAELHSSHPIGEAIRTAAKRHCAPERRLDEEWVAPGLGVSASVEGQRVLVGQPKLFEAEGLALPPDFKEHVAETQAKGHSIAVVAVEGQFAVLGFADEVREEAVDALDRLRKLGVKQFVVLTGDTLENSRAVAGRFGLEFQAGLSPVEKTGRVCALVAEGRRVAMVGDGINDAPALAQAHLGIAMGGLGSDIAMNAADVVLMRDRLDGIPTLVELGRRANAIIRGNLIFAGGVISLLTLASLAGVLPLPLAVVGHEGSTVIVILNGLRLLGGRKA